MCLQYRHSIDECASSKTSVSKGVNSISSLPGFGRGTLLQARALRGGIREYEMIVGSAPPCCVDVFYKACCV